MVRIYRAKNDTLPGVSSQPVQFVATGLGKLSFWCTGRPVGGSIVQNLRVDFGGVGAGEGLQDLAFSLGGGFDEGLFEGDAVVRFFGGNFGGWRGAIGGKRFEDGGGETQCK